MALQLVCPACTIMSDELKTCDICGKQFKHLGKHRRFHNPEFAAQHKAKTSVGTRKAQESPEYHERLSAAQKKIWSRPGESERRSKAVKAGFTEEGRAKKSAASKAMWADPVKRERMSKAISQRMRTPEAHAYLSERSLRMWAERRESMLLSMRHGYSENAARFCNDPEFAREVLSSMGKPTLSDVVRELEIPYQSVVRVINAHGLKDLVLYGAGFSERERDMQAFIESLAPEAVRNDRSQICPFELDSFVPSKKVAFEFDGAFWHAGKDHLAKTKLCEEKGIRLVHVFEWEWMENRDKIESLIRSALGESERIYARKCSVVDLTARQARAFCETNHIQGYVGSSIRKGLSLDGELVACMTFGKPRFGSFDGVEMLRYCSKSGVNVVGGESRLLRHAMSDYRLKDIISYCNRSKFTGAGYEAIGFKHTRDTPPSYCWVKSSERLSRYQTQMKNEVEVMEGRGFSRFYDCGNKVYELHA